MTPFEMAVLTAALCGLIMVAGGILLLYKGAISLATRTGDEAVTLEFKKLIKVTTHYPALGLFVIGLSFILIGLVFARPPSVRPLVIQGSVSTTEPSAVTVRISTGRWMVQPSSEGSITQTIYPTMDTLLLEVNAPGFPARMIVKPLDAGELKRGRVDLDPIVLGATQVPKPAVDPRNIAPVDVPLPPLGETGRF